eukprot:snap_masked-scaffold_23-processed-gene-1.9-mRNA-1 protein AED:1.00 eAED:1.00 QI:0/0/0/0/1/1/2/0/178
MPPRIELQLNRIRTNKFFAGFDLLSDLTTWLVKNKQVTPRADVTHHVFFSMRQIGEVLTPIGLWPHKALQWIDDSIIMGQSINELYSNVERFLRQLQSKNLRLKIEKCKPVANSLVFCGRSFDKDGWKYDIQYAPGLLNRVKPVYLHELTQLVYTANFISPTISEFIRMRKQFKVHIK